MENEQLRDRADSLDGAHSPQEPESGVAEAQGLQACHWRACTRSKKTCRMRTSASSAGIDDDAACSACPASHSPPCCSPVLRRSAPCSDGLLAHGSLLHCTTCSAPYSPPCCSPLLRCSASQSGGWLPRSSLPHCSALYSPPCCSPTLRCLARFAAAPLAAALLGQLRRGVQALLGEIAAQQHYAHVASLLSDGHRPRGALLAEGAVFAELSGFRRELDDLRPKV
ncbi:unnamed protein product [Prorocentrum cordatum]|uniref:Uncharacterized protein n=1 Tax=Prorocentrum cordatum TaxID=2364126 RepID=A0ABN9VWB9_9DINO|nr:unnamed protein product [Polarella glacialis]